MEGFFVIFWIMLGTFVFVSCFLFGIFACIAVRKRNALYSTPIVVTDASFQPSNPQSQQPQYAVNVQTSTGQSAYNPYTPQQHQQQIPPMPMQQVTIVPAPIPQNVQMPMPYDNNPVYPPQPNMSTFSGQSQYDEQNAPPPTYKKAVL